LKRHHTSTIETNNSKYARVIEYLRFVTIGFQ